MRCDEARELLWPPEEPKLAGDRLLEARRHVEACESCRDYLELDARILEQLREAGRAVAPPAVRERVFDALARERMARGASTPSWNDRGGRVGDRLLPRAALVGLAAAALLAILVTVSSPFANIEGGSPGMEDTDARAPGSVFAEDFLRRAVEADHIETTDPSEVARFLAQALGIPMSAPLPFPGFDLAGAEVCIVEGVRGAVVLYKQNGRVLYHYLIPRSAGGPAEPAVSEAVPPDWSGQSSYPSVVTWRSDGLEQALVSDLPSEELLEVARAIAGPR